MRRSGRHLSAVQCRLVASINFLILNLTCAFSRNVIRYVINGNTACDQYGDDGNFQLISICDVCQSTYTSELFNNILAGNIGWLFYTLFIECIKTERKRELGSRVFSGVGTKSTLPGVCLNTASTTFRPIHYAKFQGMPKKWTRNAVHITSSNIGRFF